MYLYKKTKNTLNPIKRQKINLEKDIQELTETNIQQIFGLKLISSEFQLHNLRIDSLAFDEETNSFVIIEYKRGSSFSVVDQGFAYLSQLLNNKSDFILEYNESHTKKLNRADVDWSQSRVIFIANSFTPHQKESINFKDLPFELWEAEFYENDLIAFDQVIASNTSESINTVYKGKSTAKVAKEIKKYTIEDHFKEGWDESKDLFVELREKILELGDVREIAHKHYIAYKIIKGKKQINFAEIVTQASGLKIYIDIEKSELKDPIGTTKDCSKVGHWATGDTYFKIGPGEVYYAIPLIKQSYLSKVMH